jgi:hypothetical protein
MVGPVVEDFDDLKAGRGKLLDQDFLGHPMCGAVFRHALWFRGSRARFFVNDG